MVVYSKTMQRKQNLTSALGIQKKIRDNQAFFRHNSASIWKKNAIHCFVFYSIVA